MAKKQKKTGSKKPNRIKKSDNKVRTGQLLAPFGVGQIQNFPNDVSIMTGGLNLWVKGFESREKAADRAGLTFDKVEFEIIENRLIKRLGIKKLYKPFAWKEKTKRNKEIPILGVRFPCWFYCRKCGKMENKPLWGSQELFYCSNIIDETKCNGKLIPVRFVAICSKGHIEDVPFEYWVHNGPPNNETTHSLKYNETGGAGDLSNILISCTCGTSKTLGGITNDGSLKKINYTCKGKKPWLGLSMPDSTCGEELQVVLKGASNVHFSKLVSSIYIPEDDADKEKAKQIVERAGIERFRDKYNLDTENLTHLSIFIEDRDEVVRGEIAGDFLLNYVIELFEKHEESEEEDNNDNDQQYRFQEFKTFTKDSIIHKELITKKITDFSNYFIPEILIENFESIVLLEKLRETIAFTGFTRLKPVNSLKQREIMAMLSDSDLDWLPANVVHGEGIFFQFKTDKIKEWRKSIAKINNFIKIISNYHNYQENLSSDYQRRDIDPVFLMIHTFAHLLIKRLCYNCGYGSSSLKERIFYSNDEKTNMCGVLVYTGGSDSEGSLGGLVNQGREQFLSKNIIEALEDASWCSADPVCIEVGLSSGQGPGSANGGACHNCTIVSETSCEEFNLLLDRAAVIGTLERPELGFFKFKI